MIGFVGVSGFGVRVEQNARVRGRVQGVVMMAAKPLKVNTDMKGAPVWTLREATSEDAGKIAGLGDVFDANLVDGLISTSEGSALVASVNLKGGEEGGDQAQLTNVVVGAVLPNVSKDVTVPGGPADQKLKMTGDIALLTVDERMPEKDDVEKKLLLGALRKMKLAQVPEAYVTIRKGSERKTVLESSGFAVTSEDDDEETLFANLLSLNPDPQKKIA
uniref:Uncharacterized protein n=1 Tax=Rhodosorus marinus TaxID=101924 RepID=A0A7S2ZMX4_9RHOD|mmetsp:Transcript_25299/g.99915  ORF Transcript_25299/g.99915 Transcript_25299/m.99915 type:complete len:218 (+) Transcript_25299:171-824(+)|eukprot:CAMPEP_0113962672 /NCGR_PEP_ID=MMETSP0011_2-20120614/6058_1 /TAXON_ID=101924 /ORGANISM="Rhodosorus marinus" /LENGTH=217 /DNA_ID=CAMNT_0000974577 /DNA_START=132 /DNA_END=785 /DNA_ORIENTATION=+ /assembly_acc=CAM_ASM_000156